MERNVDGDTDIRSLSTLAYGSVLIDQQIGLCIILMVIPPQIQSVVLFFVLWNANLSRCTFCAKSCQLPPFSHLNMLSIFIFIYDSATVHWTSQL